MAAEDEDFDVEGWNRRLADTPSGPIGPPRVRTRHLDRPRHPSEVPLDDERTDLDPFARELRRAEDDAEAGLDPGFADLDDGWTADDDGSGAAGPGAVHSRGVRRGIAVMLLGLLVLPLLIEAVQLASRLFQ